MFNPEKSAYQDGYLVAMDGNNNSRNPYEADTKEFADWLDGWVDGRTEFDRQQKGLPPENKGEHYKH